MAPKLLLLNYHRLLGPMACQHNSFDVKLEQFNLQLAKLKEYRVNFVSLQKPELNQTQLNVALTFDDGTLSDLNYALPVLIKEQIPATFFISPLASDLELNWSQIREISNLGFLIGSHGLTHKPLTGMRTEERFYEMQESRTVLEQEISKPVCLFAFPFGQYNMACLFAAKLAGYTRVFTTRFDYNLVGDGYVFHRWSIKHHTSIQEFENVLQKRSITVFRKKTRSLANAIVSKIKPQQTKFWLPTFNATAKTNIK
jgi:peptidoglycan/xylan/chitin deacetylase (PgdA/CDA1 family)